MRPLPSEADPVANTLADLRATGLFLFRVAVWTSTAVSVAAFMALLGILPC
ncbi:hypothetical protein FBZ85_106123 [Azospirillum brasilense]|uniref:Uncharacterized protein n=1 Tax=Azospirillum baldaniorum TaxID=1064539 RepID=A0A9P1JZY8_9PROT|nr:hypothetical protein [Azospirillum baldaniorum]TWA77963.1 hypothetical protein FBZ85_106123 [Azospirillum brasilense]CCD02937.1 protein of unknown function [Azospirillum baldaniorum]